MSIREIFFLLSQAIFNKVKFTTLFHARKTFIFSSLLLHCRLTTVWSNGKIFSINLTILAAHTLCVATKVFWFFIRILLLPLYHHLIQREKFFDFSNLILKLPLAHHLNQRKIFLNFFNYIIKISRVHHLNTRKKYLIKNHYNVVVIISNNLQINNPIIIDWASLFLNCK